MPPELDDNDSSDNDRHGAHSREHERDVADASATLERVRREMPFRRALWGARVYYIGIMSSMIGLMVGCVDGLDFELAMFLLPIVLPPALLGYLYHYLALRQEQRDFLKAANPAIWHSRRDRKNQWQAAVFRDAFMGRLR